MNIQSNFKNISIISRIMNTVHSAKPGIGEIMVRSLIVGLIYALASACAAAILGSMSRLAPTFDNILVWLLTGTLVCLALSPFILHSNESRTKTILAIWGVQVFVR